jgi:hypothetical protein
MAEERDLNPRRAEPPETVFETVLYGSIAGFFAFVRQCVRQLPDIAARHAAGCRECEHETRQVLDPRRSLL